MARHDGGRKQVIRHFAAITMPTITADQIGVIERQIQIRAIGHQHGPGPTIAVVPHRHIIQPPGLPAGEAHPVTHREQA